MTKQETIAEFIGFDILSNGYYQYGGEITRSLPDFSSDYYWLMKAVRMAFDTCEIIPDKYDSMWNLYIKRLHESFYFPESDKICEELFIFVNWYNQIKDKK